MARPVARTGSLLAYPCGWPRGLLLGRHYWEVGMNLTGGLAYGPCSMQGQREPEEQGPKSPENGFWVVQLCKGRGTHLPRFPQLRHTGRASEPRGHLPGF